MLQYWQRRRAMSNKCLHAVIYDKLLNRIINNEFKDTNKLPSEAELQKYYGVSRITIRRAIQDLQNDGYVMKYSGKGTIIQSQKFILDLQKLDSFSNDFDVLTEENGRLRSSISDLEQELAYYRDIFNNKEVSDSSFISSGSEKEFFQGEKKEFVLSVLSDSLQNIQDGTRKKHIIQDIIQQNNSENILNHKREKIKRLLTNYSGLNGKLKHELKQLGFTVTEDGKHYKLTYFDDNRYTITMAKTPSDGRAGKNNVSEINKKLF